MLVDLALTMMLLAGPAGDKQAVKHAAELVKDLEPGASSADVEKRTAPLGSPALAFQRCSRNDDPCLAVPESRATKRIASWAVSDRKLVVTFCGHAGAWKMAALKLSSADSIDVSGLDPAALIWKYDSDVAATCESAEK